MKSFLGCVAVLTLVACNGGTATPKISDVADAVSRNTAALGGDRALDAVNTMVKRSLIEEGDYRDIAIFATNRQGLMRIDIFADGERVFAESFDGHRGHQWTPNEGQSNASERGTIALSHTPQLPNHIFRLKDMAANGHLLELVGSETIDGIEYGVLKLTLSDGFENYLLIDSSTGWVTRWRNKRALHVDVNDDDRVIEARMSEFQRVGDILHPHSVIEVDLETNEVLTRITLQRLDVNKELPQSYFSDLVEIVPDN